MGSGRRAVRLVPILVILATAVIGTTGCSSWTLAPGELELAGQQIHSQARVMELAATAALRERPPTVPLRVMVDSAAATLSEQERKIVGLSTGQRRKAVLLELSGRLSAQVGPLRSALDSGDRQRIRQIRSDVAAIAGRLEALGVS